MRLLTEDDIRGSLVNASDTDAARMTLPGLHEVVWDDREYLGWRDVRASNRGYIVHWRDGDPIGIQLRASEARMRPGISAICSLCHTPQPGRQVALFSAPRAGDAGENGNTVGTYICADLACSLIIRIAPPAYDLQPRPEDIIASRAAALQRRLNAFTTEVLGAAA